MQNAITHLKAQPPAFLLVALLAVYFIFALGFFLLP